MVSPSSIRRTSGSRIEDGETLHLVFEPDHIHLFDPQTKRRID